MSTTFLGLIFICYTGLLFLITYFTSRKANNDTFYRGNRNSPWFVVAYGMVGASLSGVTFMSVPGNVLKENFYYLPMVIGFITGYFVIAKVLLPIYYRLNLTSIYTYLDERFGILSYKSGALFFLLSRSLGATLRMFLVVSVLHEFVFKYMGIPFWLVTILFILLILAYTFKGGIKTIVWTDTMQTTFMLLSVVISICFIAKELDWGFLDLLTNVSNSPLFESFNVEPRHPRFFLKQFFSGLFITIAMTGLDQDMMQKNLSCKNLKECQKNMYTFSIVLLFMNMLFLMLGAVLCLYAETNNINVSNTDSLFPEIAIKYLSPIAGISFVIGVLSAAYSSADGAMTALTTSFSIDIMGVQKKNYSELKIKSIRQKVHLSMAVLFFLLIVLFNFLKNDSIINMVYNIASYTYGPLLGLFFTGIYTKWQIRDKFTPLVVLLSPLVSYLIFYTCKTYFDYNFGFELLLLNGALTVFGLFLCKNKKKGEKIV